MDCIHTKDGVIIYPHQGRLEACQHPCITENGEPNHRIGQGFSGQHFYCDACGWEETKEYLRKFDPFFAEHLK